MKKLTVSEGEKVLANWSQDDFWYVALIREIDEKFLYLLYDDGTHETVTIDRIKPLKIYEGMEIEGRWLGKETYFSGTVLKVKGEAVRIGYTTGEKEWLSFSMIRIV